MHTVDCNYERVYVRGPKEGDRFERLGDAPGERWTGSWSEWVRRGNWTVGTQLLITNNKAAYLYEVWEAPRPIEVRRV
jgi:hypothetical protein